MPLARVIAARPDVFNHNVEVVPRLYPVARRGSTFLRSARVLRNAKELGGDEVDDQVGADGRTRRDPRGARRDVRRCCASTTCRCSRSASICGRASEHLPIVRYWHPDEFAALERAAYALGFEHVAAGPLVRSSYHADQHVPQPRPAWPARGAPPLIPLRDSIRLARLPLVTIALIAANVIAYLLSIRDGGSILGGPTHSTLVALRRDPYEFTHLAQPLRTRRWRLSAGRRSAPASRAWSGTAPPQPPTWETVFTSMFLHANLLHIGGNMVFLAVFGCTRRGRASGGCASSPSTCSAGSPRWR